MHVPTDQRPCSGCGSTSYSSTATWNFSNGPRCLCTQCTNGRLLTFTPDGTVGHITECPTTSQEGSGGITRMKHVVSEPPTPWETKHERSREQNAVSAWARVHTREHDTGHTRQAAVPAVWTREQRTLACRASRQPHPGTDQRGRHIDRWRLAHRHSRRRCKTGSVRLPLRTLRWPAYARW